MGCWSPVCGWRWSEYGFLRTKRFNEPQTATEVGNRPSVTSPTALNKFAAPDLNPGANSKGFYDATE